MPVEPRVAGAAAAPRGKRVADEPAPRPEIGRRSARLVRTGGVDAGPARLGPPRASPLAERSGFRRVGGPPRLTGWRREALAGTLAGLLCALVALGVWLGHPGIWTPLAAVAPPVAVSAVPELLAYSPAGDLTAAGPAGVWQLRQGLWVQLGAGAAAPPTNPPWSALAISSRGAIAVGGRGVWMYGGGRWSVLARPGALPSVTALAFSGSGTLLAGTASGLWRYAAGAWSRLPVGTSAGTAPVGALAATGSRTAVMLGQGRGPIWVGVGGVWQPLPDPGVAPMDILGLAYQPDGRLVAATTSGVWREGPAGWVQPGGARSALAGLRVTAVAVGPAGLLGALSAAPGGGTTLVWRWRDGAWVAAAGSGLPLPAGRVGALTAGPGGKLSVTALAPLAACGGGGRFAVGEGIWTAAGGRWRAAPGGAPPLTSVSVLLTTPAGSLLAGTRSGVYQDQDGTWSDVAAAGSPQALGRVTSLARAPDGQLAAVAVPGSPCPAPGQLWLLHAGVWQSVRLPAQAGLPAAVAYTPGGAMVVAGYPGGFRAGGVWTLQPAGPGGPGGWAPLGGPHSPLAGAFMHALLLEPGGTLLAGGAHGVWAWRQGKWHNLKGPTDVTALAVCPSGEILAADGNLWAYRGHGWAVLGAGTADRPSIGAVACAPNGTVYGAGFPAGVWRLGRGGWVRLPFGASNADALAIGPDGALLAGGAGVYVFSPHG